MKQAFPSLRHPPVSMARRCEAPQVEDLCEEPLEVQRNGPRRQQRQLDGHAKEGRQSLGGEEEKGRGTEHGVTSEA